MAAVTDGPQPKINLKKLLLNEKVEVRSLEDGFLGSWHTGKVICCTKLDRLVEYDHFLSEDGSKNLIEHVKVTPTIDGAITSNIEMSNNYRGIIRPVKPSCVPKSFCLHYGQCVDMFYKDAWWEGVIFDHEDGCKKRRVFFPDLGDEMESEIDKLRRTYDWDELTEKWKPRGNWLFLELIEEIEKDWPFPVSVEQIWYELRAKDGFQKLGDWTSSERCIWRELLLRVLFDNVKITIKHHFKKLDSNWDIKELGKSLLEFFEPVHNSVLKSESFFQSPLAVVPFGANQTERALSVPNDDLPILRHNSEKASAIGSSTQKRRLQWHSAVPDLISGPEFCPDEIIKFNEISNSRKKPPGKLILNVRKHLLHLDWKIDFAVDKGMNRMRYFSPEKELFYSLRQACLKLEPGSEMPMSPNNELSSLPIPDELIIEPEYCPEAVMDYYLQWKRDEKSERQLNMLRKSKSLKAKKHLAAVGWCIYYQQKGEKKEMRYCSPNGTIFYSLQTACKSCIENVNIDEDFNNRFSTKRPHLPLILVESRADICKKAKISRKKRNHEKSHLDESSPLKKRRKKSRKKVKGDSDAISSAHVKRRSSKRVRKLPNSSSQQIPQTVLSLLIDSDVILPRSKVQYLEKKDRIVMAEGRIAREGIKCSCCGEIFTLSKFEAHAGRNSHRPSANIFLKDGKSLLDCQVQMKQQITSKNRHSREIKGSRCNRKNDYICSVCHYGGVLLLCDRCPSSFHTQCLGLKEVPDGDWFCPSCCCGICGQSGFDEKNEQVADPTIVICVQCEHIYHAGCLSNEGFKNLDSYPKGNWFCRDTCEQIFCGLREILGKKVPVGTDNLSWTLVKYVKSDFDNDASDDECLVENFSKLNIALHVMHECFEPVKEPWTKTDLVEDVIFSRWSELNRLNFQGFYTVLLEKNDELISAATVRIYGKRVAEVPLIATRFQYRRLGMCRLLMDELEKKLTGLGVERLVLPSAPSVLNTWTTSFGFSIIDQSERLNLLDCTFLDFQGTVMCQKVLTNNLQLASTGELGKVCDLVKTTIAVSTEANHNKCSDQLAISVDEQTRANCLSFQNKISSKLPVEVKDDKQVEENKKGPLKCYKRRRILTR